MSNLLDTLKGLASQELVRATATSLGENESSISKAFVGVLPTILFKVLNSKSDAHSTLSNLLVKAGEDKNMLSSLIDGIMRQDDSSQAFSIGSALVENTIANDTTSVSNLVSNFAGIKSSSSSALLCIGSSLIAVFLGGKMKAEGLSFNSILGWLGQHKTDLATALPTTLASFGGITPAAEKVPVNAVDSQAPIVESTVRNKWIFPILLLALLGIGMFWWLKGCNNSAQETDNATAVIDSAGESIDDAVDNAIGKIDTAVTASTEPSEGKLDEAGNWIATRGDSIQIKLDNGTEIVAFKGSLEDKFYAFIKDPSAMPGNDVWFNFDDLLFETGKATLKKSSIRQLENTCEILKAYPEVKIKLGGYTDNTGDSMKNVSLSNARAKAVFEMMLKLGVTKTSFEAKPHEGYGPQHPVADNNTAEGKAKNRRISLSVRAK